MQPPVKRGKKGKGAPQQPQQPLQWFELKNNTSVYVTGLPPDVTVDEVSAVFSKWVPASGLARFEISILPVRCHQVADTAAVSGETVSLLCACLLRLQHLPCALHHEHEELKSLS